MRRLRRAPAAAALAALALALAGCGLAVGPAPTVGQLLVTRDFGTRVLHREAVHARAHESVLALLSASYRVRGGTRHSNVTSIDGLSGAPSAGAGGGTARWLYYVNGVQVRRAPALRALHPGDHVWWDLHDASHSDDTAAVVGAYPEPFLNGTEGKRLPVRVECAADARTACTLVTQRLRAAGVPAAVAAIGSGGAPETLRVMVGPWVYLESDIEASSIGRGPLASGVYVRIPSAGRELELLGEGGQGVRTLRGSAGLVAATRGEKEAPVWVITGTDVAGVTAAARALTAQALHNHFALAVQGGTMLPVPLSSSP